MELLPRPSTVSNLCSGERGRPATDPLGGLVEARKPLLDGQRGAGPWKKDPEGPRVGDPLDFVAGAEPEQLREVLGNRDLELRSDP